MKRRSAVHVPWLVGLDKRMSLHRYGFAGLPRRLVVAIGCALLFVLALCACMRMQSRLAASNALLMQTKADEEVVLQREQADRKQHDAAPHSISLSQTIPTGADEPGFLRWASGAESASGVQLTSLTFPPMNVRDRADGDRPLFIGAPSGQGRHTQSAQNTVHYMEVDATLRGSTAAVDGFLAQVDRAPRDVQVAAFTVTRAGSDYVVNLKLLLGYR